LGQLVASHPRNIGLDVRHDPVEENYSHSLITGASSKMHCRELAEGTDLLVEPELPA